MKDGRANGPPKTTKNGVLTHMDNAKVGRTRVRNFAWQVAIRTGELSPSQKASREKHPTHGLTFLLVTP